MNYMEQVAQMLGVEIGEEFKVKNTHDILDGRSKYNIVITENGLIEIVGKSIFEKEQLLTELLNGNCKVIKLSKPILDEKEMEYLSAVIRPFRDRVKYLFKGIFRSYNSEFIAIAFNDDDIMFFPSFEVGIMYKGMELEKEYTLEDLGL